MCENSVIYCDEAGNDGPNYLNPSASFYVLAGWIMPESALVDVSVTIETLRQTHCRDANEVKFATFKRRPRVICETMSRLGQKGLVPIYLVAEKRFCIAAKIVETLIDPAYNDRVTNAFASDLETKRELANTFYDRLADSSLKSFANAYRDPTPEKFEQVLTSLTDDCKEAVNPETADILEGSRSKLSEIAEAEVNAVTSWGKEMGTLNLPCLISFLMIVEELGRKHGNNITRIVHDEHGAYQQGYLKAFEDHRSAERTAKLMIPGMVVPYGAIKMVQELEFQASEAQPLVQAADLLAGSIAHISMRVLAGRKLHEQELKLARFVLPPLILPDIQLAFSICSNQMLAKFGQAIKAAFPLETGGKPTGGPPAHIQWKSSIPDTDVLPLLPAKPVTEPTATAVGLSVKIDLPLFGIVNDSAGSLLLMLPPEKTLEETPKEETCVPLWTRRSTAESFLAECSPDFSEPHHIVEFGPKDMPDLIEQLRGLAEWSDVVAFNLFDTDAAPCPILRLADDLERIWNRVIQAGATGILQTIYQTMVVDSREIGSVLLSTGEYAAMELPNGPVLKGSSREEAINRAIGGPSRGPNVTE